jgi:hypothetical protein
LNNISDFEKAEVRLIKNEETGKCHARDVDFSRRKEMQEQHFFRQIV